MRFILALTAVLVAVSLAATTVDAQPRYGDIVVTSHNTKSLCWIDRKSGTMTTLATFPTDPIPVIMAANNTDILVPERAAPGNVWNVTPTGTVTTVAQASGTGLGSVVGADWLQSGELMVCASAYGTRGWLRSVNLTANSYTTIFTAPISHFRHAAINQKNGNAMVCLWASLGNLLEVDLVNQTYKTFATGLASPTGVDSHPMTGNFLVAGEGFSGSLKVVSPTGKVGKTIPIPEARGVKVEDSTGLSYVCTSNVGTKANSVVEVDNRGIAIRTYGPYGTTGFASIELYGSHQVHGSGTAKPGTSYKVDFAFPGVGPINYVGALSFSQGPGFKVGGTHVNLAVDGLFLASLQGLFVTGFQGILDKNGYASGTINLPSFVPKGARIFCGAVATNGTAFLAGSTIGITVQ